MNPIWNTVIFFKWVGLKLKPPASWLKLNRHPGMFYFHVGFRGDWPCSRWVVSRPTLMRPWGGFKTCLGGRVEILVGGWRVFGRTVRTPESDCWGVFCGCRCEASLPQSFWSMSMYIFFKTVLVWGTSWRAGWSISPENYTWAYSSKLV